VKHARGWRAWSTSDPSGCRSRSCLGICRGARKGLRGTSRCSAARQERSCTSRLHRTSSLDRRSFDTPNCCCTYRTRPSQRHCSRATSRQQGPRMSGLARFGPTSKGSDQAEAAAPWPGRWSQLRSCRLFRLAAAEQQISADRERGDADAETNVSKDSATRVG